MQSHSHQRSPICFSSPPNNSAKSELYANAGFALIADQPERIPAPWEQNLYSYPIFLSSKLRQERHKRVPYLRGAKFEIRCRSYGVRSIYLRHQL